MDIDKNNTGLTNPEPEREENQLTDTLKANILHEAHTEINTWMRIRITFLHSMMRNKMEVNLKLACLHYFLNWEAPRVLKEQRLGWERKSRSCTLQKKFVGRT